MKVTGVGQVPAAGMSAVAVKLTVTAPTGGGLLTTYADGAANPGTSDVNAVKVANLAVEAAAGDLMAAADGGIDLRLLMEQYVGCGPPILGGPVPEQHLFVYEWQTGCLQGSGGAGGAVLSGGVERIAADVGDASASYRD